MNLFEFVKRKPDISPTKEHVQQEKDVQKKDENSQQAEDGVQRP